MKIGQMSLNKLSNKADYIQLDICGLNKEEALEKYKKYNTNKPVILHGDWDKKTGLSENNLRERYSEYLDIISSLKNETEILGITIHPPYRTKFSLIEIIEICQKFSKESNIPVFVENRSNKRINLSKPDEIIEFSKNNLMTIDIPQLYISCGYDEEVLVETLKEINMNNVKEIHFANILRTEKNSFVARKIYDGNINLNRVIKYLPKDIYYTLEILGGVKIFDDMYNLLSEMEV